MRRCIVDFNDGKHNAWFHRFCHEKRVLSPSALKGGHEGGEIEGDFALVETVKDGRLHKVVASDVCFIDPPDYEDGRMCEYFVRSEKPSLGMKEEGEWKPGIFRAWSTDYEEFSSGPAPLPVAIVEDALGFVHSVYAEKVRFPRGREW